MPDKNVWQPIESFDRPDKERVDLWLYIYASPRSMGMSDAFKVPEAWRDNGKWYHVYQSKPTMLDADYITHWSLMPSPRKPPKAPKVSLW